MTFNFNATAPATAGTYNFQWKMVDGSTFFGQQSTNVAVTSGFDSAQFVSQDVPASMVPGASYPVSVTMKNTSSIYWAPSTVSLGSQNPDNNTTWGMSNVALASYVAPGANATFTFNVTAPATLGTQNFQWRLLKGAGNWIGPATPNVPVLISADEATFVSQSVPATMQPGKVYSATITLHNTGVSTWSTTALHRLGSQNPQDNSTWGLSRVAPGARHDLVRRHHAQRGGKRRQPRLTRRRHAVHPRRSPQHPAGDLRRLVAASLEVGSGGTLRRQRP